MFKKLKYWLNRKNPRFWKPFDPSLLGEVKVGDLIMIEKLSATIDYIALSMGIPTFLNSAGAKQLWKIKKHYGDDILLKHGTNRTFIKYNEWEGNVQKCEGGMFFDPCKYAFYYHKGEK